MKKLTHFLPLLITPFLIFFCSTTEKSIQQSEITPNLLPKYGTVELKAEFQPDPHSITVSATGSILGSTVLSDCRGYFLSQPTFALDFQPGAIPLSVYFNAENNTDDATLLIRAPNGTWHCNDDATSVTLDPMLTFNQPESGRYMIWVGVIDEGEVFSGELKITEYSTESGKINIKGLTIPASRLLEVAQTATTGSYGSTELAAWFEPDPFSIETISGGRVNGAEVNENCNGYVASQPDYVLNWTGENQFLRFLFVPNGSGDTTLMVLGPDNTWSCNDDADENTVHPMVQIDNPATGLYKIWVGSFSNDVSYAGSLHITERLLTPDDLRGNKLDLTKDPLYGDVRLDSGFSPSPYVHEIISGGSIEVDNAYGPDCAGFANTAPDFQLHWSGADRTIEITFTPHEGGDTTLIINTPNGDWVCNDDADENTVNPLIRLKSANEGRYDIWIGSYSSGEFVKGDLKISEL